MKTAMLASTSALGLVLGFPGLGIVSAAAQTAGENVGASATRGGGDQLGLGDIVVTARKREETSLAVPVTVTAVSAAELERRSITNLDGVARIVPQLIIGENTSVQGGAITMRGIAGPDSNPFGDQAVSFNIDGVQIAKASVRRMSETDLQQIEVLKGPQALFYGKNSPGGVVSLRTADPTPTLQAKLTAGYEFHSREKRVEGYISTPLSDTLGLRVAGYFSQLSGDMHNEVPDGAYLEDKRDRLPYMRDLSGRITLKWNPSDRFDARFKFNIAQAKHAGTSQSNQYIDCPTGSPQTGSVNDCKVNNTTVHGSVGAIFGSLDPLFRDGQTFGEQTQILSSLEMNYHVSDDVTLTSITGLYNADVLHDDNYQNDYALTLPALTDYENTELSQEIRAQTSFDGPLNFTAGAFLASTKTTLYSNVYLMAVLPSALPVLAASGLGFLPLMTPLQLDQFRIKQKGTAYSGFLQMSYKPVDTVEITAGGRYSYEKKKLPFVSSFGNRIVPPTSRDHWSDFSPELSVSYRPNNRLTLFANYKHGFLSGGFNAAAASAGSVLDISYDPQTIKGFEGGVKALLLDDTLRVNLAAYTYKMSDIQVVNYVNVTSTIKNAASGTIKGAEFDLNYRTPINGLSLHGAVAYNRARYTDYVGGPCFNGQRTDQGCTIQGGTPVQDLSGVDFVRAPRWTMNAGFNLESPINGSYKIGLSTDVNYSSSYITDAKNPFAKMPKYALVDASVRFSPLDDRWELAFIGRNLTNKRYWVRSEDLPFTGSGTGTPQGMPGDRFGAVSRGSEFMLRASYRFGQ